MTIAGVSIGSGASGVLTSGATGLEGCSATGQTASTPLSAAADTLPVRVPKTFAMRGIGIVSRVIRDGGTRDAAGPDAGTRV